MDQKEPRSISSRELAFMLSLLPKQRISSLDDEQALRAMWWVADTKRPWRDLPPDFGKWNTIARRHRKWKTNRVFDEMLAGILRTVSPESDSLPARVRYILEALENLGGRRPRVGTVAKKAGVRSTKRLANGRFKRLKSPEGGRRSLLRSTE